MTIQHGYVTTEGDNLYYEVRGQGAPLVLISGGGGDSQVYTAMADILVDEYKVITYDRRANARSTMHNPHHFTIAQQSRDVVAVLHAAGEESALIFGNSSGAVIALDMAATQPQAIRTVIVHEPPLVSMHPNGEKWRRFYASVYATGVRFSPALAAMRFIFGTGFPIRAMMQSSSATRGNIKSGAEQRIDPRAATAFLIQQELLPVVGYVPDIETIKRNGVKIVMAAGRESLDKHRWYAETCPVLAEKLGCELVILPGHHVSFVTAPVEWAAALRDVLHKAQSAESKVQSN